MSRTIGMRAVAVSLFGLVMLAACTDSDSPGAEGSSPSSSGAVQSWEQVLGSVSPWVAPERVPYEDYGGLPARIPAPAARSDWPPLLSDLPGRAIATYYAPPKCDPTTFENPLTFEGSSWDPQVVFFLGTDGDWRTLRTGDLSLPPPNFDCTDYTFDAGSLSPDGRWWQFANGSAQGAKGWIGLLNLASGELFQRSWETPRKYYPPRVDWVGDDGLSVRIGRTVTQYRLPFEQPRTMELPRAVLESSPIAGPDGSWLVDRDLDRRPALNDPIPVALIDTSGEPVWSAALPRPKKDCYVGGWWPPHLLLPCPSYGSKGKDTTYVIRADNGSFQVVAALTTAGSTFQYYGEGLLTQQLVAIGFPGFWNWRTNEVGQTFKGSPLDSFGYGAHFSHSVASQLVYGSDQSDEGS